MNKYQDIDDELGQLSQHAKRFYENGVNRGHARRQAGQGAIEEIRQGLISGHGVAERSLGLVRGDNLLVLDVGCSWGPVVAGAARSERVSGVIGVDIEDEALGLGKAIVRETSLMGEEVSKKIGFTRSPVESLPFRGDTFDLIICHTVIEHVNDVEQSILEMYRVLKPGGVLHIEAPNYLWPYEPHLGVWMLPLSPKRLIKAFGRFDKTSEEFIDHLNFVHPFQMEKIFKNHGITFRNIYQNKMRAILLEKQFDRIIGMNTVVPFIKLLGILKLSFFTYSLMNTLRLHPSLEYEIVK